MRQKRERRLHLPTLTSNMQGEGSTSAQTIAGMWNLSGGVQNHVSLLLDSVAHRQHTCV